MRDDDELRRLTAEVAETRGYLRGRVEAVRSELLADEELRELLRAQAWAGAGRALSIRDGRPTGHPRGWPKGVDGDAVVAEYVDARLARLVDVEDPPAETETVSESVRRFREGLK